VAGGFKRQHNEELHNLYVSPIVCRVMKSKRIKWAEHIARMGEMRNVYNILVGKPEGKRQLGRPRRRCEDNIRMNLREKAWEGVHWIHLVQSRKH